MTITRLQNLQAATCVALLFAAGVLLGVTNIKPYFVMLGIVTLCTWISLGYHRIMPGIAALSIGVILSGSELLVPALLTLFAGVVAMSVLLAIEGRLTRAGSTPISREWK